MTDVPRSRHVHPLCPADSLAIAGRCVACIGEMGLRHPQERILESRVAFELRRPTALRSAGKRAHRYAPAVEAVPVG